MDADKFLELLTQFPPTKSEVAELVAQVESEIDYINPLALLIRLKRAEALIKQALASDVIKGEAVREANNYPKGDDVFMGAKFNVRTATSYDYSHDAVWQEASRNQKEWGKIKTSRQSFLKALDKEIVDPESGEFVRPAIVTAGDSVVAITLPK